MSGSWSVHNKRWKEIVDLTEKYAGEYITLTAAKEVKNILITYVSAYGYTKLMAEQIADGIIEKLKT